MPSFFQPAGSFPLFVGFVILTFALLPLALVVTPLQRRRVDWHATLQGYPAAERPLARHVDDTPRGAAPCRCRLARAFSCLLPPSRAFSCLLVSGRHARAYWMACLLAPPALLFISLTGLLLPWLHARRREPRWIAPPAAALLCSVGGGLALAWGYTRARRVTDLHGRARQLYQQCVRSASEARALLPQALYASRHRIAPAADKYRPSLAANPSDALGLSPPWDEMQRPPARHQVEQEAQAAGGALDAARGALDANAASVSNDLEPERTRRTAWVDLAADDAAAP